MRIARSLLVSLLCLAAVDVVHAQQDFKRGDADGDGCVNGFDMTYMVELLFLGGPLPECLAAGDVNGDGQVNVADVLFLANFVILDSTPPPAPGPETCGPETGTSLGCVVYDICGPCTVEEDCTVVDNGSGTIDLPPENCGYLSEAQLHMIVDGLPPGTMINASVIHGGFENVTVVPGGVFGGQIEMFDSTIEIEMEGTGDLAGFQAKIVIDGPVEVHSELPVPGEPVQTFNTAMMAFQAQIGILGDTTDNFDSVEVLAGDDFGLPSPGMTTLTEIAPLSGPPMYQVDSSFNVSYQISFVGAAGGALDGLSGMTMEDAPVGTPLPVVSPDFLRGDSDGNATFNALADGLHLLTFGFLGGPPPPCLEASDADGDATQNALADALYILTHGFLGGPPPSAPYPDCGADPDLGTSLGCDSNDCP